MRDWIVAACRSEAKIFERASKSEDLRWLKTLTNKKGRRKNREFETDKPGMSYAKFSASCVPHALEGKHQHSENIARHFANQISNFVLKSYEEKRFDRLNVFAGAHFLGILKSELSELNRKVEISYTPKNIEKSNTEKIMEHLA